MSKFILMVLLIAFSSMASCATAPETVEERQSLEARAQTTVQEMIARDPGLQGVLDRAYGAIVFPDIGKGGAIVGAAWGRGVLFERGRPTGYVELNQASLGAQLGGQTFAELVVLQDRSAADRIRRDDVFEVGGDISAVALTAGAAAGSRFSDGMMIFQMPRGGMMVELSVSGQKLNFEPRD